MLKTSLKAETSSRVTCPSAFAILALNAIIAIANATVLSGGVFNFSKTLDKLSPFAKDDKAFAIRDQSVISFHFFKHSF
jgi:hypothetical protein